MIYLTVGIKFGGIYKSQVVGVCQYLSSLDANTKTTCVSFIPIRNFFTKRREIKGYDKSVLVLPVFFKSRYTLPLVPLLFFICLFTGQRSIMGRGVVATRLGLILRKLGAVTDVIYDGRGGYVAELEEYGQVSEEKLVTAKRLERSVVTNADFRLAVSHKLVEYWEREYGYRSDQHVIIPCTIDQVPLEKLRKGEMEEIRRSLGLSADGIVLVYSGAAQSYQSFFLIDSLLSPMFAARQDVQLLLLSDVSLDSLELARDFPDRVVTAWLRPQEVHQVLSACDWGLLFREAAVTNEVAAPTKFVEYLAAGLPVMISEGIGDYSQAVKELKLGLVANGGRPISANLHRVDSIERLRVKSLANQHFTKESFREAYEKIVDKTKR